MRATKPLLRLLQVLQQEPDAEWYGYTLFQMTGSKGGTLYPLLDRLEHQGWITARWAQPRPLPDGQPSRKLYSLTEFGCSQAQQMLAAHSAESQSRPRLWSRLLHRRHLVSN